MKKVYVYPHTHWDYEWYFTSNESIVQLIYHMDDVIKALEDGDLDTYLLDGQLSILEEYIKFMPSKFNIIKKLVENNKLIIGPWYTQTDELIIDGESIVRNLYFGIKTAMKYGDYLKIGYLPDSFGQSKDMPKILNGFNINWSIFWRGVSSDVCSNREFIWESEDGSRVLVYNIKNGYFYGGNLIYNNDVDTVEKTFLNGSKTEHILLPVGGDQRFVDFNLKDRIKYYNENSKNNLIYVESTCEKFFKELEKSKELKKVKGEFINPSNSKIHRSIYSSRYDHKYLNDKIERRLIYQLEPLMVIAQNIGLDPKIEMIEEIWKKLLMNHAHDSACGCNSDKTNKNILYRLIETDQLSYSVCDYVTRKISESLNNKEENNIILFNTLPYDREEVFKMVVTSKFKDFKIIDNTGKIVEHEVLYCNKEYGGSIRKDLTSYKEELFFYVTKIVLKTKINSLGMEVLKLVEINEEKQLLDSKDNYIEDKYYKIEFFYGKINIKDKINNIQLEDCVYIEESGDDGDTYDYSPPEDKYDFRYNLRFENAKFEVKNTSIYKEIKLTGEFLLPLDLNERKLNKRTTKIPYKFKLSLTNKNTIECKLEINNKAYDHRMRVVLKTCINTVKSISDTPFGVIKRDNVPEHIRDWRELGWKEEPSPIYPMLHFVCMEDKNLSAVMLSKGIKEYEILNNSNIALTLFRGVGYLGKPDLIRRPGVASGNEFKYIETPDSQLIGKMKFKFAIYLGKKMNVTQINKLWKGYSISILNYQIQEVNKFTNTIKYFVMHPLNYKINKVQKIVNSNELKNIVITSIAPIDSKSFVIRLVNYNNESIKGEFIKVNNGVTYQWVNLNNKVISEEEKINGNINLGEFKPGEIKTLKVIL